MKNLPTSNRTFDSWLRFQWPKDSGILRPGQSFCNYFNILDRELFFETDSQTAWRKINEFVEAHQL